VAAEATYNSWTEIAEAMSKPLNAAYESYSQGKPWEEARDLVNEAYFGFYEKEGFERFVKQMISGKRASTVEFKFATIKGDLKKGEPPEKIKEEIDTLVGWLMEDGAILDEKFGITAAPAAGGAQEGAAASQEGGELQATPAPGAGPGAQPGISRGIADFGLALGILLREGFEAILVIAAIAAYLRRSGHEDRIRAVYLSSILAVVVSFLAALAFQKLFASQTEAGQRQELLEGVTMLIAALVLFGVGNWMFSKAEAEAWKSYIEGKVKAAVTGGSAFALSATAFLAVFREGAETILFYQSLLINEGADKSMIFLGFLVGCVGLAVIFIVIRLGTMKLPLKPFFIGTSVLMLIMSLAFAGGGVKELMEGDVVQVTPFTAFPIPTIDILGLYPYFETLAPQALILAVAIASVIYIRRKNRQRDLGGDASPA
jgi:high-affinity iron transporter